MSYMKRAIEMESPAFLPCSEDQMDTQEQYESADFELFMEAVWREEDRMLREEGAFHVDGMYYANAFDAEIQRRWRAEQIVREAARAREQIFRTKQILNSLR